MIDFKNGYRLFTRNLGLNILVVLLLTATFLAGALILNFVSLRAEVYVKFLPMKDTNSLVFIKTDVGVSCENIVGRLSYVDSVDYLQYAGNVYDNRARQHINATFCGDTTIESFPIKTTSGVWLNDAPNDGTVYAVIEKKSGYKVGDVLPITVNDSDLSVKICGLVADEEYFDIKGTVAVGSLLTPIYNSMAYPRIFIKSTDVSGLLGQNVQSFLLTFEREISERELLDNVETLKTYGNVGLFDELLEKERSEIQQELHVYLPLFVISVVLTLFGLVLISYITVVKNSVMLGIFKLCGAKRSNYMLTFLWYYAFVLLVPVVAYVCVSGTIAVNFSAMRIAVASYPAVTVAVCMVLTAVFSLKLFKKEISEVRKGKIV